MLAIIWEPFRFIFMFFESLVVLLGSLFVTGQFVPPGDYFAKLNRTGIYDNRVQEAMPQTAVHDIVLAFFEADHGGKTPKCLIIGYDGARADALINTRDNPAAGTQVLKAQDGAIYNMYTGGKKFTFDFQDTSTAPGWTAMLTGRWAKEKDGAGHTVTGNGITKPLEPKLVFTELLDAGLAQRTAFIVSWSGHFTSEKAAYLNDMAYCVDKGYDAQWVTKGSDADVFAVTLAEVQKPACADMTMCILEYCDHEGHATAFGNTQPNYVQAIKDAERDGAALIAAVKARTSYGSEDWLILIASDHGGTFNGHGLQFHDCRQVFLAANRKVWG